MKPSASDFLILFGLILSGIGLFFWHGLGVALTITGAIVLIMGIAANIAEHTGNKIPRSRPKKKKGI